MVARASGEDAQNAAVVALANKLARIAWAVLRRKETFNPSAMALA
jgi:hypothetical protein